MTLENQELARARAELHNRCDVALLSSLSSVAYVSGFQVPHAIGVPATVAYGAPFAVVEVSGTAAALAAAGAHAAQAKRESRLDAFFAFATFDSFEYADPRETYFDALRRALQAIGMKQGWLGIEARTLPYGAVEFLSAAFPNLTLVEIADAIERARLVKTPREIARLRRAAQVASIGQNTLRALCQTSGLNEIAMYAQVRAAMEQEVGGEIPVVGELVTGPRTTTVNYPDGPRNRMTQAGDAALMDISQRVDGYWSDVTNTYIIAGQAKALEKKFARASQAAFDAAFNALRPGARASDVWAAANAAYEQHGIAMPHYMGHQLGVTVNELPRLVPYDHTPIEANMVFAIEPGAYQGPGGSFGARSEKNVLVTPNGAELLADFEWGI